MAFSKIDLDSIKSKISLRSELEKKTRLIQKGKDYWCCCPFHEEKTPSCKINDDQNSFYCFGCGAKGDIFTIYTELYNYNFIDSVKELSQRAGVEINFANEKIVKQENKIFEILKITCEWFQKNLEYSEAEVCNNYLNNRKLSKETIKQFQLGFSYNKKSTLYDFLKNQSFSDQDLLKSNVVKISKNNKIRDYFYKRLIFPIKNIQGSVVGFGGRALDDTNPKYINSPESNIFQKRYLLYNLDLAKNTARKKNNLLICEGYMDVISLFQNGISSVVAPLGTALTENQLQISWKYSSKPTIMFDGDAAGVRASYKSAIMALSLISAKKFLQFIILPSEYDPDSYINKISFHEFVEILKKPVPLVNFIFNQSSQFIELSKADDKIAYDNYLDDLVNTIKDQKTKFFYKGEFKSLFFEKIRQLRSSNFSNLKNVNVNKLTTNLSKKQNLSFIATAINHLSIREKVLAELLNSSLFDNLELQFIKELQKKSVLSQENSQIIKIYKNTHFDKIIDKCLSSSLYQLFPYAGPTFDPQESYQNVLNSLKNMNTRLSNLKKINKSLNTFVNNSNALNWSELQNINLEILDED